MQNKATTENESFDYGAYSENTNETCYTVFNLQRKLYYKAKQEPKFRFYSLYSHVYRADVIAEAYKRVHSNKGGAGVDGIKISDIAKMEGGVSKYLEDLSRDLKEKTYRPQPIKRVYIPKANGKKRPLGIPTVRDRIAQTIVTIIIEPIFESEFLNVSYGFRPKRGAHDALKEIKGHLDKGYNEVYDADLSSYFDTIPRDKLMKCLERRITDRHLLKLIRMFIDATVKDEDGSLKKTDAGTPQGGVISPLLANLYLHWLEKLFYGEQGPGTWAKAHLVRYADDFVIIARYIDTRIENWVTALLEGRMGLTINKEKTSIRKLKATDTLNFLGYTFRRVPSKFGSGLFTVLTPSEKSVKSMRAKINDRLGALGGVLPVGELIGTTNQMLRGWCNYFSMGYNRKAYRDIMHHTRQRLKKTCLRKSQRQLRPPKGMSWYKYFHETHGLIKP